MRQLNDALHKAKLPEQQAYKLIHLCIHTFYAGGCGNESPAATTCLLVTEWAHQGKLIQESCASTPLYLSCPWGSHFLMYST